ncbi:MAG: glycoside hydrolase domain-containing protein [Roseiarcus sp.]
MNGYAGFDRLDPPTAAQRAWLRKCANANLRWLGGYLPSPSQPSRAWCGLWPTLRTEGWGLAPVYVGQQAMGPGSHIVTAARGAIDGRDACVKMAAEGFPAKSRVFLDLESPSPEFIASGYVAAWIDAVFANAFSAAIYCSFAQGPQLARLRPNAGVDVWVYHVPTVGRTSYPTDDFPDLDPQTSGFAGASLWQLRDNVAIPDAAAPGGWMVVDLDSSIRADPSAAN